jgi:hypothetical protein
MSRTTTSKTSVKIAVVGLLAAVTFITAASTFAALLTTQETQLNRIRASVDVVKSRNVKHHLIKLLSV